MLDLVIPRIKIRNELIKIVRMLLGLGPVVVGDLPKPPQDSSSKELKENFK
jgi:acetyl-CoA carboxylase carboxyl transferase subunit beta